MAATLLEPGLEHVHLAFMGFGPMEAELLAWEADPLYGGRLHVLPAVSPDDLDRWVASADVSLMPNQPETLNEIVSTPNKLFESIAAGVPVVTSDFPERRRVVLEDPSGPLGAVCDPTAPQSIAAGIVSIVGDATADPTTRMDLRRRCLRAAHERWNWEAEGAKLLALYRSLDAAEGGLENVWVAS
jgi:glycosyltransferase involved in cell wall biosynthesis